MVKSQGWELLRAELDNRVKLDFVDPQGFKDDNEELTAHRKLAIMKKIVLDTKFGKLQTIVTTRWEGNHG